ncbi:MAG: hypothetical protein ACD_2C00027G0004 [uncultured bacterium (gcode 4)]|uniref:VWFA domain-containing protein n=1 Tax=uncultured bacterium (gcode 4) TaxID=1234023 RepID=K2FGD9_9BACT|nr:MAG: hypothetical protein ACD_2C00027G0004 [uncultured bacterium (gcode 4)]
MALLNPTDTSDKINIQKLVSWCDYYSQWSPISISIDPNFDWPAAIDLGNLNRPRMILNPVLMKEKLWYNDAQIFVDVFHEIEHYVEESDMESTNKWRIISEKRKKRLLDAWMRWKTMHKIENIMRDCYVDNQVISPTKAPVLKNELERMFRNSLYKWIDYEKEPLHIQLMNAIWREYRLPDERCKVSPKVRIILERLKRNWSLRDATTWPLDKRLENIWANIEPQIMKLFEEDLKNQEEQKKNGKWAWAPMPWAWDSQSQQKQQGTWGSWESKSWEQWQDWWAPQQWAQWENINPWEVPDDASSGQGNKGDKKSEDWGSDWEKWQPQQWASWWEWGNWNPDKWNPSWEWENKSNWAPGNPPSQWWDSSISKPQAWNPWSSNWKPETQDAPMGAAKQKGVESLIEKMRKKLAQMAWIWDQDKGNGESDKTGEPTGKPEPWEDSSSDQWSEWNKWDSSVKWNSDWGNKWEEGDDATPELTWKNPFESYYDSRNELSKLFEESLWTDNLKQLSQAIYKAKTQTKTDKTREQLERDNRVKNMWVDPKDDAKFKEHLRNLEKYDNFLKELENLVNPKTWEFVMTEIEELFEKIRSHRLKPKYKSRWPVDMDRGVRLDSASLAGWIADIESWNLDPYMFEEDYREEKEDIRTGNFELTLVTDWSQSMSDHGKNPQQKIACLLIFEALKRLHDRLADAVYEMKSPIEFSTSWIMFKWWKSIVDIKGESSDFTDKDRIDCFNKLDYCRWWDTNDYDAIDKLIINIKNKWSEYSDDMKSWKIKNIVVVLTDWDSTNAALLKKKLQILRGYWVIIYAIWITAEGRAVKTNYFSADPSMGYWEVCEDVNMLSVTLEQILFEHLEKL